MSCPLIGPFILAWYTPYASLCRLYASYIYIVTHIYIYNHIYIYTLSEWLTSDGNWMNSHGTSMGSSHWRFAESYFIQLSQDGEVEDGSSVIGPEPQSYLHLRFDVQFSLATVDQKIRTGCLWNHGEVFFQIDIFLHWEPWMTFLQILRAQFLGKRRSGNHQIEIRNLWARGCKQHCWLQLSRFVSLDGVI